MIPNYLFKRLPFLHRTFGLILLLSLLSAQVMANCKADAGTLGQNQLCFDNGKAILTATPSGDAFIPNNFTRLFVLTSGDDLVIEQVSPQAAFEVDPMGSYTIHTLVFRPNTLDLSIVVPGMTTGFDVNALLQQGGGDICAALDVAGAKFSFDNCTTVCGAFAGTLRPRSFDCIKDGSTTIKARPFALPIAPAGFSIAYVLTKGDGLVIQDTNSEPEFDITEPGKYTIHTLVFDANTLDLDIVVPGTTTGFDVNGLLIQGGGDICAALDVPGAEFYVESCDDEVCEADFGEIKPQHISCYNGRNWVRVAAKVTEHPVVPDGFKVRYVLTFGDNLVILATSRHPVFFVKGSGKIRIHTLVYDPETLDLGAIKLRETKAGDLLPLLVQGGGDICAALDVEGAAFVLSRCGSHATSNELRSNRPITDLEVRTDLTNVRTESGAPKVFPNPASEQLEVQIPAQLSGDQTVEMAIFNAMGQQVRTMQLKPGTTNTNLNISNFTDGMYIIQMRIGQETYLQQFTKTKR